MRTNENNKKIKLINTNNIQKDIIKNLSLLICTILAMLTLIACSSNSGQSRPAISNGYEIPIMPTTTYINEVETAVLSRDMKAVIIDIDTEGQSVILHNPATNVRLKYSYTGGTDIVSRYDAVITPDRLMPGEVVDVSIVGESTRLSRIKISNADFDYSGVTNFKIDKNDKTLTVGNTKYFYSDNTVIVNGNSEISIDKLDSIDTLRLRGVDKELDSIIVTQGHGYLRLDSTTFFEGGYIEIGDKIVELITENMVLPVPAGRYEVSVSKDKTSGSKEVVIHDNEEIRINLTEFQSDAVRLGTLSFKISPEGARLTIDGVKKDYSQIIDVAYGTHKIVVTADGYEPYAQVITVDSILAEYNIMLVREGDGSDNDSSDNHSGSGGSGASDSGSAGEDDNGSGNNVVTERSSDEMNNTNNTNRTNSSKSANRSGNNNVTTTAANIRETTAMQTIDYSRILDALFG